MKRTATQEGRRPGASYLTLAASPNGVLYGISDFGMLYKIDKTTGASTLIGDTKQRPKFSQSMTFDPNSGLLYWGFMNDDSSALFQVNTTTATAYKICDMPNHEEFIGLYVKKAEIADKAPMPVTELSFKPNVNGGTVALSNARLQQRLPMALPSTGR